jgi:hypothetical protein
LKERVLKPLYALAALSLWVLPAAAQEVQIEEVPSAVAVDPAKLKPRTMAFSDQRTEVQGEEGTGLVRFADWTRSNPVQKQFLGLHPAYSEPTINVVVHGIPKRHTERLHMYVAEARFVVPRAPGAVDLSRFARLEFLTGIDPAIKHKTISADEVVPHKDPESAHNRHPNRRWCEGGQSLCIESRYQLEGKLPTGIRLANKLEEGGKTIADFIEFQSELRVLAPQDLPVAEVQKLTGFAGPVAGAIEQNLFHVNQMMQFGKFLAVLQGDPMDANRTVVTAFVALAIESDVLEKKKEYERVPVLRNLVPAQVLMGNSSFNTGTSISAGLPAYSRNRLKAVAEILHKG